MATRTPPDDPRLTASVSESSVLPVVALSRSGPSGAVLVVFAIVAALLLFMILDARRRAPSAPAVRTRASDRAALPAPPPPLYVPPQIVPQVRVVPAPAAAAPRAPAPAPQIVYVPQYVPAPAPEVPQPPPPPPRSSSDPVLVVDNSAGQAAAATAADGAPPAAAAAGLQSGGRARSGMLANPSMTVAQGTLIQAVLETALNSTRPGLVRAIVSSDVRGFDGTRVLIPRGSRLIGEYRSETAPGQNRAMVIWTRLIRPDGVTIAIGSPAGDPLGRGGIRARVNSHFFERFAGAILQSALDVGVNLASRAGTGTVVVGLPGSVTGASQVIQPSQITPTLSVRQGTSVSIFVARDLDFSGAESRR